MIFLVFMYMIGFSNLFKASEFESFKLQYYLNYKNYSYIDYLSGEIITSKNSYKNIKSLYFKIKFSKFYFIPFIEKAFISDYKELKDYNYLAGFSLSFKNFENLCLTIAKNFGYFEFENIKRNIDLFYLGISNSAKEQNFEIKMGFGINYFKILSPSFDFEFKISDTSNIEKIKGFVPSFSIGIKVLSLYFLAYADYTESSYYNVMDDYYGNLFINLSFLKNKCSFSYNFNYRPWIQTFGIPGIYYYGVENKFVIYLPFKNLRFGISYSNFNARKRKEGAKINEKEIDIILKVI